MRSNVGLARRRSHQRQREMLVERRGSSGGDRHGKVGLERATQTPRLEDWSVEDAASGSSGYGWFVSKSALVTPRRRREAREGLALTEEAKRNLRWSIAIIEHILESHEWCLRETEQTPCRRSKPLKG